jgi:putative ABC transport system permease protein
LKLLDLTELAGRNLREALLRNSLTVIGIGVGVASLVAMLSLGVGLQNLANDRLARSGMFNAIFVSPRTNLRGLLRAQQRQGSPGADNGPEAPLIIRPLDDEARQTITSLPNVIEVYPEIRFPTEIRFNGDSYPTVVAGIQPSARSGGAFDGMKGSFFSSPGADEAILQSEFAKQLSDMPDSLIGKDITLRYAERQPLPPDPADKGSDAAPGFSIVPHEEKLHIIGLVDTDPAVGFGGMGNGRVLIPLELAEKLRATQATDLRTLLRDTPAKKTYENLTVRVSGASQVQDVENAIKQMGFGTFSLIDATNNLRLVFAVFDLLLGIFGSLALVVASLGIINTLVMAILERRREIGVLKAIGAADRDVRRLFFAEAGVMGLLGGFFGVLLGWLISRELNYATKIYLVRHNLPIIAVSSVPGWMIGAAVAFAVIVSLAAGIYPASRAAKLDPVEALRYD